MTLSDRERRHIETLARDNDLPQREVEEVYIVERERLERVAKVRTFVPLIAGRLTKERLKNTRH